MEEGRGKQPGRERRADTGFEINSKEEITQMHMRFGKQLSRKFDGIS